MIRFLFKKSLSNEQPYVSRQEILDEFNRTSLLSVGLDPTYHREPTVWDPRREDVQERNKGNINPNTENATGRGQLSLSETSNGVE